MCSALEGHRTLNHRVALRLTARQLKSQLFFGYNASKIAEGQFRELTAVEHQAL